MFLFQNLLKDLTYAEFSCTVVLALWMSQSCLIFAKGQQLLKSSSCGYLKEETLAVRTFQDSANDLKPINASFLHSW